MKDKLTNTRLVTKELGLWIAIGASLASISAFVSQIVTSDFTMYLGGVVGAVGGAGLAVTVILSWKLLRPKKTIFVSYAHADVEFIDQLLRHLSDLNVKFLVDRLELKVGDNIKDAVDNLIDAADSIIFVISKSSSVSDWSKKELEQAVSRKKKILPIVLDIDSIPDELSGLFYADFTREHDVGFAQLRKAMK